MKANIHPKWFDECKVSCACGNMFVTGASIPELRVEVCSKCHPFYTGQMKYLDTAGRVDAFKAKLAGAKSTISKKDKRKIKKQKQMEKELERPDTLEQLRKQSGK